MILPLLAAFYCATFVWFDAYRQKTLIMKASYAVSDVLSRQEEVDEPFLDDMRDVLDYMIPSNAAPKMRISLINSVHDADGESIYTVEWSYGPNGMTDLTQADIDADSSWIPLMGDNDNVVVTETAVLYQPIFRVGIDDKIYRNTIVTRPRFHGTLTKKDEPDDSTDFADEDDDGDGSQVGSEDGSDTGGASTGNGNVGGSGDT
jgi:Flp pilus assembly protein TadG